MIAKVIIFFLIFSNSVLSFAQHFEGNELVFPERRIAAFVYKGANEDIIRSTLPRITSREGNQPGSWVYEWSRLGAFYNSQGEGFFKNGQLDMARDSFLVSSNYYAMAWFPTNSSDEEKVSYYEHLRTYLRAGEFFDVPLEVVNVPYRDDYVPIYLHSPVGVDNPPLILYTQGADQFKANAYPTVMDLVAKGFAVGTFDLLGTGENEKWLISPSGDDLHVSILDYFIKTNRYDNSRISFVGFSLGGYYAAKLATRNDPRINSIVSFCPVIHSFAAQSIDEISQSLSSPEGAAMINLLRRAGAKNPSDPEEASKILSSLSLLNQGLVGQGESILTRLLVANGTRDPLGPLSDMNLLYNSAKNADLWLLGEGEHCAVEYLPVAAPQIADWILSQ
jgi:pimeloyl-ACP methyl ester carboxylesterase